jgi:hypothetical protein
VYGANTLSKNIEKINGEKPALFFKICWYFLAPSLIVIIWVFNWINYKPIDYGNGIDYKGQTFGWCIALISLSSIPIGAIHAVIVTPGENFYKVTLISIFFY